MFWHMLAVSAHALSSLNWHVDRSCNDMSHPQPLELLCAKVEEMSESSVLLSIIVYKLKFDDYLFAG